MHVIEPQREGRVWVNPDKYSYIYVYTYLYLYVCVYICVSIGSAGHACCRGPVYSTSY